MFFQAKINKKWWIRHDTTVSTQPSFPLEIIYPNWPSLAWLVAPNWPSWLLTPLRPCWFNCAWALSTLTKPHIIKYDHIASLWLVGGFKHLLFFHILGRIIPTDFHIFQRGRYTTNQKCIVHHCSIWFWVDLHRSDGLFNRVQICPILANISSFIDSRV